MILFLKYTFTILWKQIKISHIPQTKKWVIVSSKSFTHNQTDARTQDQKVSILPLLLPQMESVQAIVCALCGQTDLWTWVMRRGGKTTVQMKGCSQTGPIFWMWALKVCNTHTVIGAHVLKSVLVCWQQLAAIKRKKTAKILKVPVQPNYNGKKY